MRDKKVVLSRVVGVAILLVIFGFMFQTRYLDREQIVTYRWNLKYISFVAWVVGFLSLVTPPGLGGDGGHRGLLAELLLRGPCGDYWTLRGPGWSGQPTIWSVLASRGGCDGRSTCEEYGTRISGEARIRVAPSDPERESCYYCGGRHHRPMFRSFHPRIVQCEYCGLSWGLRLGSGSWWSTDWGRAAIRDAGLCTEVRGVDSHQAPRAGGV